MQSRPGKAMGATASRAGRAGLVSLGHCQDLAHWPWVAFLFFELDSNGYKAQNFLQV
jgi:hypothetical protein